MFSPYKNLDVTCRIPEVQREVPGINDKSGCFAIRLDNRGSGHQSRSILSGATAYFQCIVHMFHVSFVFLLFSFLETTINTTTNKRPDSAVRPRPKLQSKDISSAFMY